MADNAITIENARTDGVTDQSYWDVPHSTQIEGFTTDISVNAGDQIDFKINVNGGAGSDYVVEVFRLGYYGGAGARKVAEWTNTNATVQPEALYDASRGLVDAGNWSVTDSWLTPSDAVSGVYLARVQRLDANGNPIPGSVNQIPFIIREDDRPADIVLQTSDTTWHAYNGWGGNNGEIGPNLYGDPSGRIDNPEIPGSGPYDEDRAYAVSYNRPFITRGIEGQQGGTFAGAQDYLFGADYAAIQWLEQNGYDVAYMSGVDTDRLGASYLTKYQAFISVGHDEYWSGDQRYNVEAARDAGVNLLFWSGNEMYWKTRYEGSIADGDDYRTLVTYKETVAVGDPNAGPEDYYNLDPSDIWTGTWRDTRFYGNPLAGGPGEDSLSGQCPTCNCAENQLTGQLFGPDGTGEFGGGLDVEGDYAQLRVWRDTSIATGGATGISAGLIGYEWNTSPDDENRPAGLVHLSESVIPWGAILVDQGSTTVPGYATHNLSLYRADSGALVFGAGTTFWSWMLSNAHDSEPYGANIENTDLQQFTVNLFADMGIQPAAEDPVLSLQGLVRAEASTDAVAATATIDDLPASVSAYAWVTITGTATDDDGNAATEDGVVALVEVSVDGGVTWRPADGTAAWSYSWLPTAEGNYDIRVRAIDDSLNMPNPASLASEPVTVTAAVTPSEISLFELYPVDGLVANDAASYELGTRFTTSTSGSVTELRYYRGEADAGDTDVRTGHLWNASGDLLATVTFTSAPGETGWQTAALTTPVVLQTGQVYTVSYTTANNYLSTIAFFSGDYTDPFGVLTAPSGTNGVFAAGGVFPITSSLASNYWADVTFVPYTGPNVAPTFTMDTNVSVNENRTLVTTLTATDLNGDALSYAITGGADAALFVVNATTGVLRFAAVPNFEAPGDANGDNAYEVTVSVTDGINPAVTEDMVVTVADVASESGDGIDSLFGPSDTPPTGVANDGTSYELGTRFLAHNDGEIDALMYFRGTADSDDTDIRTLNLWSATGTLLGSVAVTSGVGASGWQTGTLAAPVAVEAGLTYVVSYGTADNYVATANYFLTEHTSADGMLVAPSVGNGVLAAGATGVFPTQTFSAANYWTDVVFTSATSVNAAPFFSIVGSSFAADENQTAVLTLTATDPDGDGLTYAIAGGADAAAFQVEATTGVLTFAAAPDFELPGDANGDNAYEVTVSVSDGVNPAVARALVVNVADVAELPVPTAGDDVLTGTDQPDSIDALAGNDTVFGLEGDDVILGRLGDDLLDGGPDNDRLIGGVGDDTLLGRLGDDELYGRRGADRLVGGVGDDKLYGGVGNDTLYGRRGNDELYGGGGDDRLAGGVGDDLLVGDTGSDTLIGGLGADVFKLIGGVVDDVIVDFEIGIDTLDLLGTGVSDFAIDVTQSNSGADRVLSWTDGLDNHRVVLEDLAGVSIDAADVIWT